MPETSRRTGARLTTAVSTSTMRGLSGVAHHPLHHPVGGVHDGHSRAGGVGGGGGGHDAHRHPGPEGHRLGGIQALAPANAQHTVAPGGAEHAHQALYLLLGALPAEQGVDGSAAHILLYPLAAVGGGQHQGLFTPALGVLVQTGEGTGALDVAAGAAHDEVHISSLLFWFRLSPGLPGQPAQLHVILFHYIGAGEKARGGDNHNSLKKNKPGTTAV